MPLTLMVTLVAVTLVVRKLKQERVLDLSRSKTEASPLSKEELR